MTDIGETLIDYELDRDIRKAVKAGVIKQGDDSELEDRHISLFDELLQALDDKEVYVTVRNLVKYHRADFVRVLEYMEKEGE